MNNEIKISNSNFESILNNLVELSEKLESLKNEILKIKKKAEKTQENAMLYFGSFEMMCAQCLTRDCAKCPYIHNNTN